MEVRGGLPLTVFSVRKAPICPGTETVTVSVVLGFRRFRANGFRSESRATAFVTLVVLDL